MHAARCSWLAFLTAGCSWQRCHPELVEGLERRPGCSESFNWFNCSFSAVLFADSFNKSKSCRKSASFLARDQPFNCFSLFIPCVISVYCSKYFKQQAFVYRYNMLGLFPRYAPRFCGQDHSSLLYSKSPRYTARYKQNRGELFSCFQLSTIVKANTAISFDRLRVTNATNRAPVLRQPQGDRAQSPSKAFN